MTAVRFVHAGDMQTDDVLDLVWTVGCDNDRFQEVAIAGDKVIGSWSYTLGSRGKRYTIDSCRTDVAPRFRRRGIAIALWLAGVARWNPVRIDATIASSEGRWLLARVHAELRYRAPQTSLIVNHENGDANARELWNEAKAWACESMLERLAEARATKKAPAQLTAIAGGKS